MKDFKAGQRVRLTKASLCYGVAVGQVCTVEDVIDTVYMSLQEIPGQWTQNNWEPVPDYVTPTHDMNAASVARGARNAKQNDYREPVKDLKFDKGKLLAGIIIEDFPRALKAILEVATFGAEKYERSSWQHVDNAQVRYGDAKVRHQIEGQLTELDEESGKLHLAHEVWNGLALLELKLREQEQRNADK